MPARQLSVGRRNGHKGSYPFSDTSLPGGHSEWEPPDSIPNSEVKTLSADDSVGPPHAKVGHCQAFIPSPRSPKEIGGFFIGVQLFWNDDDRQLSCCLAEIGIAREVLSLLRFGDMECPVSIEVTTRA